MSRFPLLLLAPPFLLHCVIQGLILFLSFNIFLSNKWISENETLWANQGLCASLGCSLKYPTDESIRGAQSVAFSRKPTCCLIDSSKDKTTLYFGGLSIWKAVNSIRPRERVNRKRELGCKERRKMHLLAHLGQGFRMIYRLAQGLVYWVLQQHKDVVDAAPYNWAHPICLFTAAGSWQLILCKAR